MNLTNKSIKKNIKKMNALLNNDCISFFDLDDNCENCEGLIYFCGDIIYSGEIENNLP